ncbi:MAG: rhomboid family intramembrane serine protease [Fluviicola sp.]|nr:rhomboid family intramembrane serine protease [Fluviicola sp.]
MQTQATFIDSIRHQLKHGGMTVKLIFINLVIFIGIRALSIFSSLLGSSEGAFVDSYVNPFLGLQTDFMSFITHPWALFTYMFTHYGLMHLLWNMIFLYFAGRMFEQLFNAKRLLATYILGGILGGLLEVIAYAAFEKLQFTSISVVGASGSIMAIFVAVAFYRPNTKVNLFGFFSVRIIFLAIAFILMDFFKLDSGDNTAHFAHLGGAILGVWSIQNVHASSNIVTLSQGFMNSILKIFAKKDATRMKVKKGGKSVRHKSDEDYNTEKKSKQEVIDKILDKISKSGYESLTKKEKDFLFNQSKK